MRELKHDHQNLLFPLHSYISESDLEELRPYYDQAILPTRQMMNLFPANPSMLDNMKVPEIRGLLSLKLMMAQEKGLVVQLHFLEPVELGMKHTVNLVRMLNIILDNAIGGVSVTKKRRVELIVLEKNHSVMIHVTNITTNILPLNQLKQKGFSTKTNSKNKGLGLLILDELTKTNPHLLLETSIENQRFS